MLQIQNFFKNIKYTAETAKDKDRAFFHKTDLLFVFLILLLAGVFFYWNFVERKASSDVEVKLQISVDNQLIFESPLQDLPKESFTIAEAPGYVFGITENRSVKIIQAPCPDGLCMLTAWLERPGEAAICVPGKLVVRTVPASEELVDDEDALDMVIGQADPDSKFTETEEVADFGN